MSEKLPVARCGDCLYSTGNALMSCVRESPIGWQCVPDDWCGEFVHRVLGPRVEILVDAEQGRFEAEHQNWRFPTEPEE